VVALGSEQKRKRWSSRPKTRLRGKRKEERCGTAGFPAQRWRRSNPFSDLTWGEAAAGDQKRKESQGDKPRKRPSLRRSAPIHLKTTTYIREPKDNEKGIARKEKERNGTRQETHLFDFRQKTGPAEASAGGQERAALYSRGRKGEGS